MSDREQFLDGIIITALEGGIGYWSVCSAYTHHAPAIAQIRETDDYGEPVGDLLEINRDVIRKGLKEIIGGETNCHSYGVKHIAGANAMSDPCDIDASFADIIVQVGLFGNIVYG